ncbi:uncharacterized protein [Malus domestica]|uniref:uncharacterized protein n=1 Tax=Malus domestica TaxID=3750 RepID=UPI003975BEBC
MALEGDDEALMYKLFSSSLSRSSLTWFRQLKSRSIESFTDLCEAFISQYVCNRRSRKDVTILFSTKQNVGESLKSYMTRFTEEMSTLEECDSHTAALAFREGVLPGTKMRRSLIETPPLDMREVMARADGIIRLEEKELIQSKRATATIAASLADTTALTLKPTAQPRQERSRLDRPNTKLTVSMGKNFYENKGKGIFRAQIPIRTPLEKQDRNKMCAHHNDFGHTTNDCQSLRNQVEAILKKGMLSQYHIESRDEHKNDGRLQAVTGNIGTDKRLLDINIIHGGPEPSEGREVRYRSQRREAEKSRHVHNITSAPETSKALDNFRVISFSQKDLEGIQFPHNDALVVMLCVANSRVKRVMIDGGSSTYVLFWSTFRRMKLDEKEIRPNPTHIYAFEGTKARPIGDVTLLVTAAGKTLFITFVIIDAPSAYNAIMGRDWIHRMDGEASTRCQVMRCLSTDGQTTIDIKGDQLEARKCYSMATDIKTNKEQLTEDPPQQDQENGDQEPPTIEPLREEVLDPTDPEKRIWVGSLLSDAEVEELMKFLRSNVDVFAWYHRDMLGIDPEVACHQLNVDLSYPPHRQKQRRFAPERYQSISKEVDRLIEVGFIRDVWCPTWVSNVVVVGKKEKGKWRVCVDYTNLNRACRKDCFPIPKIDQTVDATAGYALLSFLDAYSGYNQIPMAVEDQEKTAFITERGLYCYTVMPFGLKNAGSTYQRLVNKMFKNQIGNTMEVYIDDMVVKSRERCQHIDHLRNTFDILRRYHMRLNLAKCAFGVSSGQFLGHIVNKRGIEPNPAKLKPCVTCQIR